MYVSILTLHNLSVTSVYSRNTITEIQIKYRDTALNWYTSNLAERTHTFQVGTDKSKTFAVNCSVLQGSILGPLKFIAYTEDLPSVDEEHNVDPYFYTDVGQLNDHVLLPNVGAAIPKMENYLDAVHKWCAS